MLSKLFPRDTRSVEIVSSSILLIPIISLFRGDATFIDIIYFLVGVSQIFSVWNESTFMKLRAWSAWSAGTLWIYVSIYLLNISTTHANVASLFLGISDLIAFMIIIDECRQHKKNKEHYQWMISHLKQ